jgi:hypothetical protein
MDEIKLNFIDIKERFPEKDGMYLVLTNEVYDKKWNKIKLSVPKLAICGFTLDGKKKNLEDNGPCFYETLYGDGAYYRKLDGIVAWSDKEVFNFVFG